MHYIENSNPKICLSLKILLSLLLSKPENVEICLPDISNRGVEKVAIIGSQGTKNSGKNSHFLKAENLWLEMGWSIKNPILIKIFGLPLFTQNIFN